MSGLRPSRDKKPRLIALANVKDESWIIERWLQRTSEFTDGIIVLDDGSTDETPEILEKNQHIIQLIRNPPGRPYRMVENRNRLLQASREFGPDWVFFLDADEIMDARLADRIGELMDRSDVGRYYFQEITLWRSAENYRADHPEKYMRVHHGFPVMVRLVSTLRWMHPSRRGLKHSVWKLLQMGSWPDGRGTASVLTGVQGKTVDLPDVVKLHYHFADWERAWRRHVHYAVRRALEERSGLGDIPEIVKWAVDRLDEESLELMPVRPEWGAL